jgi:hypothetical protein
MSSAPVSTRRYQDSDSRLLNLMAGRSGLLASWLRLSLAAILNGRIMQHDCNLLYQLCFAKSKVLLQKCSIITSHLAILFFARGFAPRTSSILGLQDLALVPPVKSDGFTRAKVIQARACLMVKRSPSISK